MRSNGVEQGIRCMWHMAIHAVATRRILHVKGVIRDAFIVCWLGVALGAGLIMNECRF